MNTPDESHPTHARRPSRIEELREKLEAKTQPKKKGDKTRQSRGSFHDNIYFKQDREKVLNLIRESQNKGKPKKKKKRPTAAKKGVTEGSNKKPKKKTQPKSNIQSTKSIRTSNKTKGTTSKRVIKNSYLKGAKEKVLVGTKGAKKLATQFKKKAKKENLTEIEVPGVMQFAKGNKSASPRNRKKISGKGNKLARMASPKKTMKKTGKLNKKKGGNKVKETPGAKVEAKVATGNKQEASGVITQNEDTGIRNKAGSINELDQLISKSRNFHNQLKKSITKENLGTVPGKQIKKSKSTLNMKKSRSKTPAKKLKNSQTIKNLKNQRDTESKSIRKKSQNVKRRKSKSATRETFSTKKQNSDVEEVVFATEKKFMRMKSARRIRPKEEYESGIPLRQKPKPKAKLRLKKKKKKKKTPKMTASNIDTQLVSANVSFDGDYESEFISEIQTRAIVPGPSSQIFYNENQEKDNPGTPDTRTTVKKDSSLSRAVNTPKAIEGKLESLILEEEPNRESVSYKYFQTDGKFSDQDEQAELKNSLFAENYQRQEAENNELLSSRLIGQEEYTAELIFEKIQQKTSQEEVNETLDKIQTFHETREKDAEADLINFIDSKKQSMVEGAKLSPKVKMISQQNIDFEGLIIERSGNKGDSLDERVQKKEFDLFEEAKQRARVITFKAANHKKVLESLKDLEEEEQRRSTQGGFKLEYQIRKLSNKFIQKNSHRSLSQFEKILESSKNLESLGEVESQKPKAKLSGSVSNHFNMLRGRCSIAQHVAKPQVSTPSFKLLTSIQEQPSAKPFSVRDLVKLNTKKIMSKTLLDIKRKEKNSGNIFENKYIEVSKEIEQEAKKEEAFVRVYDHLSNLNEPFMRGNWVKNYLKNLEKKMLATVELKKMDEDMDLIKSKIEMTENNIQNDLKFFNDMLAGEGDSPPTEAKIGVSKYFSQEESIILEEKEEEYFTYENSADSMEDLRSIYFSKKADTETEAIEIVAEGSQNMEDLEKLDLHSEEEEEMKGGTGALPPQGKKKASMDFDIQSTNSVFIGKLRKSEVVPSKDKKDETKKEPVEVPKKVIKKKSLKSEMNLSTGRTKKLKKQKSKKKIKKNVKKDLQKNNIKTSIRESKIFKINTVTDFDLRNITSSESEESSDSDWEDDNYPPLDHFDESIRSSRDTRKDSDCFAQRPGDVRILRILHESQRMLEKIKLEDSEDAKNPKMGESELEKFQKSQAIYFKERDLKNLSPEEECIRQRIKTSNRLIQHIERTQPNLEEFSRKDLGEVKLLIEQPFKYKSFDKLTENEKKERIDLEIIYKKKIVEKINQIIDKHEGRKQGRLITKEIENVVSGRTLQRWKHATKLEVKAVRKIQQFFRFKIEERIGKKIMEMQKAYYKTRASIINPPK